MSPSPFQPIQWSVLAADTMRSERLSYSPSSRVPLRAKWGRPRMVAPRSYGDAGGKRKAKKMEDKLPSQSPKQRTPMTRRSFFESKPHARNWSSTAAAAVIFSPIGAVLVAAGLIVASASNPPPLVWVKFAFVSIILIGLALLAMVAFQRQRSTGERQARRSRARAERANRGQQVSLQPVRLFL
jgi:hypothetical protein